jgi:ATP-dependent helicase/nuclease subunit A
MGHPLNEQQLAALDRHLHCAVLANAGSGKTRILIERFLRAVVLDGVPIENIVAITFTKAAAAEMRERIHERIEDLLTKDEERAPYTTTLSDADLVIRLRSVSRSLALARISTFHSFCAGLVRQYADVVGIPHDVRDADDRESAMLVAHAVATVMRAAASKGHHLHQRLLTAIEHISLDMIEQLVTQIARDRGRLRAAEQLVSHSSADILRERAAAVSVIQQRTARELLSTIEAALRNHTTYNCYYACHSACVSLLQRLEQEGFSTSVKGQFSDLQNEFFTKKMLFLKKKIDKDAKNAEVYPELSEVDDDVLQILSMEWDEAAEEQLLSILRLIAELGITASQEYTRVKRSRNVIDFDDMIHEAIALLQQEEIQHAVRSSITHVMIDEFQDTDPTQYRILELLAPDLVSTATPGPFVFVVGDDKQSIYQFRNADVRLFRRARHAITQTNLCTRTDDGMRLLSKSFRMHPDLCDAVNSMCSAFFAGNGGDIEAATSYDVPYEPLVAGLELERNPSNQRVAVAEFGSTDESEVVALSIAEALASANGLLRPKDIAILVPKNSLKAPIANALRRYGIPFTIYGGRSFFSRPEIADLRNALISCIERSDNLATASVMRSPLLRCSDEDIASAALSGSASSIQDGLAQLASAGLASPAQLAAVDFFQKFSDELHELPSYVVLEHMLEHTRWYETVSGEERYDQMIANTEKLIGICRDFVLEGGVSHFDVLRAIAVPVTDNEAESTVLSDDDAVHIMTLHGAKGLEFDLVVLAGLTGSQRSVSAIETSEVGLTVSIPGAPCLSHYCNKTVASTRRRAEDRRLLYVALTRAKQHLILCLPSDRNENRPLGLAGMITDGLANYGKERLLTFDPDGLPQRYQPANASEKSTVYLTEPVEPLSPWTRTPSSTTLYHQPAGLVGSSSSAEMGSAIHTALAAVVKNSPQLSDDELMEQIVRSLYSSGLTREQTSQAAIEVFSALRSALVQEIAPILHEVRIEQQLAMMDGEVLLHGVLDVRLPEINGMIEVWDWKTSSIRNAHQLAEQGALYTSQMQAYAKLCFASFPSCTAVRTRLVFTKALQHGIDPSYVIDYARADF